MLIEVGRSEALRVALRLQICALKGAEKRPMPEGLLAACLLALRWVLSFAK